MELFMVTMELFTNKLSILTMLFGCIAKLYVPIPNALYKKIKYSEMHDEELAEKLKDVISHDDLVLPMIGEKMVVYKIEEYHPLLDSSNVTSDDWITIAEDIEANYEHYDGFIVLHGTDTLAYTASALSFMLENLQKPVILTGSQIPIFETRSDAKNNFLSSLILAGCYDIPEVCIFFGNKLLRGNRTAKISSNLLNAFDSPNYHPLAEVGIDVRVYNDYIWKTEIIKPLKVHMRLNTNVGIMSLFPTINACMMASYFHADIQGMVLLTYGAGNVPSDREDFVKIIKDAIARGVIVVNITQCLQGAVSISYEPAKALEDIGVISGNDMTTEAALTKLNYILGIPNITYEIRAKLMKSSIRGELTENPI